MLTKNNFAVLNRRLRASCGAAADTIRRLEKDLCQVKSSSGQHLAKLAEMKDKLKAAEDRSLFTTMESRGLA
ncbi:unnamed protein product [Protopolystoma xenopodis]|uniref:Uncharacterized protein n=1 Tax=Protopolystoma xenopodis TaxID=117903 RepID=A0A448XFN9_9PLAT|nr:unnamed protein product [Protopolystoma xenopodis]